MTSLLRSFEGPIAFVVCLSGRLEESAAEFSDSDKGSEGGAGGEESSLLFVFLDFVECCFKNRASAGRGNRAGRLSGFAVLSDGVSGIHWRSLEVPAEASATEQSVRALSLHLTEFKRCVSSGTFLFLTMASLFNVGSLTEISSL